jgi:hypothetical protein
MADKASDSRPQGSSLRVELGFTGTIRLVASPVTELALDRPASPSGSGVIRVDRLTKPIVVTGRYHGTREKLIPASLVWLVHYYDPPDYHEAAIPGHLHLQPDGRFTFKATRASNPEKHPELDVLQHRLFGKGAVGYRLTPRFPHAPSEMVPPGLIEFDNPLDVRFARVHAPRIGTRLEFKLDKGRAVEQLLQSGHKVRLVIDEEDAGEARVEKGYQDLRVELEWDAEGMDEARPWFIGCSASSTPEAPRFEYPEAKEEGDYEFSYRMLIEPPQGRKPRPPPPIEARKPRRLVEVARPALASFSLAFEPARESLEPRLVARGELTGLDSGIKPSVDVSLWRKGARGEGRFTRVSGPLNVPVEGGRFEAELYTLPLERDSSEDEPLWQWASVHEMPREGARPEPTLFATVCFNTRHLGQPKLPAYASLDFDSSRFDTLDEGRGVLGGPEKAGSICSAESRRGFGPVVALRRLFEGLS